MAESVLRSLCEALTEKTEAHAGTPSCDAFLTGTDKDLSKDIPAKSPWFIYLIQTYPIAASPSAQKPYNYNSAWKSGQQSSQSKKEKPGEASEVLGPF